VSDGKKTKFVGFRLDATTKEILNRLSQGTDGNKSEALRRLVKQAEVPIPKQERESML